MHATSVRYLLLSAIALLGAGAYTMLGEPLGAGTPRWPTADAVYFDIDSAWSISQLSVEENSNHTLQVTRAFSRSTGAVATFTMFTNQAPKLYGAGAEVPFLGNGYAVTPAPSDIAAVAASDGVRALVASQGTQRWLVMYAYGERRGLLGNGALPWTLAVVDGLAGRPNDYYKLYLVSRTDQLDPSLGRDVAELAHLVFPRIAAWYAA